MREPRSSLTRIFLTPALIAAFCGVGLIAALVGDGAFDVLSWIGLSAPVAALGWALLYRRS